MLLVPPTMVRRDGNQLRVDAVHENSVFCTDTRAKAGFLLDLGAGVLQEVAYHPLNLVTQTESPDEVLGSLAPRYHGVSRNSIQFPRFLDEYEDNLWKLSILDVPNSVITDECIPVVVAFMLRTNPKEIHQGLKTAYGLTPPKMIMNYLTQGYQFDPEWFTIEMIARAAMWELHVMRQSR